LTDGIPISQALRDFTFTKKTLYRWCEEPGPVLLGRRLGRAERDVPGPNSSAVEDVLHVSRGDLERIEFLLENPLGRKLPGNDGVWLAKGIYRNPRGVFFARNYLEETHGVHHQEWTYWLNNGHPALEGITHDRKPRSISALWPTRQSPHGGRVVVLFEGDVEEILRWRDAAPSRIRLGGSHGAWLSLVATEGKRLAGVYRDEEGVWVTNAWVQHTYKRSEIIVNRWCQRPHPSLRGNGNGGRLRRKRVPKPHSSTGGRAWVYVYLENEIRRTREWPDGGTGNGGGAPLPSALPGPQALDVGDGRAHSADRPVTSPAGTPGPGLNETETSIVDWVRNNGPAIGEDIAAGLGYPFNSYLRQTLSSLAKHGVLRKATRGYAV
jgi:hypothetical protein